MWLVALVPAVVFRCALRWLPLFVLHYSRFFWLLCWSAYSQWFGSAIWMLTPLVLSFLVHYWSLDGRKRQTGGRSFHSRSTAIVHLEGDLTVHSFIPHLQHSDTHACIRKCVPSSILHPTYIHSYCVNPHLSFLKYCL